MKALVATDCGAWRDALDPAVEARLVGAIDQLSELPILDATSDRISRLCERTETTTSDLVDAVKIDHTFAANVLRNANADGPVRARTLRQAVMLLGRRNLRRLSVEPRCYRFLDGAPGTGTVRGQLHLDALTVATASAGVAEQVRIAVEAAHLSGLLHDVGKLVLPLAFGVEASADVAHQTPGGGARAALERERFGVDHAQAGALLAVRWGCAREVAEAIAYHHGGPTGLLTPSHEAACVQLANGVAHILRATEPDHHLVEAALRVLGLDVSVLERLAERAITGAAALRTGSSREQPSHREAGARVDDLTGLASRQHWLEGVRAEIDQRRSGTVLRVAVDGLAEVTRAHGYQAANLILAEVARIVAKRGLGGRIGGVVLGLWLEGSAVDARETASRIQEEIAAAIAERSALPIKVYVDPFPGPLRGQDLEPLLAAAGSTIARKVQGAAASSSADFPALEAA